MKRLSLLTSLFIIGSFLVTASAQSEEEKQPVGEYLYQMMESDGVEAAIAEYQELKKSESSILEKARKEVLGMSESNSNGMNPSCMENEVKRQFDFWIGEWDVYVDGEKRAESRIERTLDGCMILENYSNNNDYSGKSMNFYDVKLEKWVQIWTDSQGNISRYRGEMRDGKMYFNGTNLSSDGKESMVRMEFTPSPDGSVRQLFEQSTDGGKTWETLFDGTYRLKKTEKKAES